MKLLFIAGMVILNHDTSKLTHIWVEDRSEDEEKLFSVFMYLENDEEHNLGDFDDCFKAYEYVKDIFEKIEIKEV